MSEESVSFDRPDDDSIGDMIQGISGESELFNDAENSALPQYFGRAFIPLKASTIRNRFGLEAILRSFFRMPINVYDFEMGEYDLPARFRNVSGHSNITLGQNFQIGSRYHSLSEKIRIVIGPIKFSDAKYLMPGGKGFDQFAEIINRYLDRPLKYDVDFDIVPESIPESSFAQPLQ